MSSHSLVTTDRLAAHRARLANERTLLAYVRTALALLAFGAALIHLFPSTFLDIVGGLFLLAGGATLAGGGRRYFEVRRRMSVGSVPPLHERRNGHAVRPPRVRAMVATLSQRGRR